MKTLLSLTLAASLVLAGISGQSVVVSASTCSTNPYATVVVSHSPAFTGNPGSDATVPGGAEKVLGAPERITSFSDVNFDNSGSTPGYVTVGFTAGTMITNGPGPDIRLHFNDLHGEPFSVFASHDGATFVSLGSWNVAGPASAPSTVDVDLATGGLASARYIKIVNDTIAYGSDAAGTNEGPDIDGIQMLSCGPIVTPTATPTATPTPTPTATPTATPTPIPACQNGLDDDGDGLIDMADPGCSNPNDNNEGDGTSQCQDGIDNDNDGALDFPNDFSCSSRQDNDETNPKSACQDGLDNDSDGLIDLNDPGCASRQDNDETHVIATPTPTPTPTATPTPKSGDASFEVTKSDGKDTVRPGQSVIYTIKIKNTGDVEVSDLELVDTVPNALTITKVTPAALTRTGQLVKWAGIHLNEGEEKEFKIFATVKSNTPDTTVIRNTARVQSDDFDTKEAATDSTTVKKQKVVVASGPAIASATHVPVTAQTGPGSLVASLASAITGAGLFIARKRLV